MQKITNSQHFFYVAGRIIQKRRKLSKMPQRELAAKLGISQSQYSKIEKGISTMSLYELYLICEKLNVNPSEIWADVERVLKKENGII